MDWISFPEDLSVVGLVDPGDALCEHGLPGAVVAAQRGHLAIRKVEVDVVERLHGSEMLVELPYLEQRSVSRTQLGDGSRHITRHYLEIGRASCRERV